MKDTLLFDANKNIKNSFEKKFKRSNPRELMVAQEFYNTNISKIDFNAATPLSLDEYKN
jgi:hypothetical protein